MSAVEVLTEDELQAGHERALRLVESAPDLPEMALLQTARQAANDLVVLVAVFDELQQRLWDERLDFEARQDLALDAIKLASRVQAAALTVLG